MACRDTGPDQLLPRRPSAQQAPCSPGQAPNMARQARQLLSQGAPSHPATLGRHQGRAAAPRPHQAFAAEPLPSPSPPHPAVTASLAVNGHASTQQPTPAPAPPPPPASPLTVRCLPGEGPETMARSCPPHSPPPSPPAAPPHEPGSPCQARNLLAALTSAAATTSPTPRHQLQAGTPRQLDILSDCSPGPGPLAAGPPTPTHPLATPPTEVTHGLPRCSPGRSQAGQRPGAHCLERGGRCGHLPGAQQLRAAEARAGGGRSRCLRGPCWSQDRGRGLSRMKLPAGGRQGREVH
ncbi:hypothetical protein V8C86DRAFT_1698052 [Haematococcus lacustris]